MAAEINRIANATDFNGVHLLNGNLSGEHDGSGLVSTGEAKIHFGSGNDPAEDYYYLTMGDATIKGLGLSSEKIGGISILGDILVNGGGMQTFTSGIVSFAIIPAGTTNLEIHIHDNGANDSIELFTRDGAHVAGTAVGTGNDWTNAGISSSATMNTVLTEINGFLPGATYDGSILNGTGLDVPFTPGNAGNSITYNGMNIGYSGNGNPGNLEEFLTIDNVTEDLVLLVVGSGVFTIQARWGSMPGGEGVISIQTQELAQQALITIDEAIIKKDQIRAHLGAMQNRLENTVSNLQIQAENLQTAESRISDADVASEMTDFARARVLTQAAVAMLSQANSLPQMAMQLLQG
jgi:flagellin